jgi:hypothetical protein
MHTISPIQCQDTAFQSFGANLNLICKFFRSGRVNAILFLLCLMLLKSNSFQAQTTRASHWFFGYKASIDFSSGFPVADTSGQLVSIEGSGSISDSSGHLLCYSNGEDVWNNQNDIMPNGQGLKGSQSTEQSCLFVPQPGSNNLYYLFYIGDGYLAQNFRYSIIDTKLHYGLGDVTAAKNIPLLDYCSEALSGTMACNAVDYWIVVRQAVTDSIVFYAYLLTQSGLEGPVRTSFHLSNPAGNTVGCLRFTQDGSFFAFCSFQTDTYLFNFNNQSGQISLKATIPRKANESPYSVEISPDMSKLYATGWFSGGNCYLSQYDLTAGTIVSSRVELDSADYRNGTPSGFGYIGHAVLGPDQHIYVSRWNVGQSNQVTNGTALSVDSLGAVLHPNLPGLSCGFHRNYFYLGHRVTQMSLPNFLGNYSSPLPPVPQPCTVSVLSYEFPESDIKLYPNPLTHFAILELPSSENSFQVIITDVSGQACVTLASGHQSQLEITRDNLVNGFYFVQIWEGNKLLKVKKLLIQ